MNINQIIQITTSNSGQSAKLEDLSLPLILAEASLLPAAFTDAERVRVYTSIDQLIADGFDQTLSAYKICQAIFQNGLSKILIGKKITADTNYSDTLEAVSVINNDFYAVLIASQNDDDIKNVAQYVQSRNMIFFACTKSADVISATDTDDVASYLKDNSLNRTVIFYDSVTRVEASVAGAFLATPIGRRRIAYLSSLAGANISSLSASQSNTLKNKNCSFYVKIANVPLLIENVQNIKSSITVIMLIDCLKQIIQTTLLTHLTRNKVSYDSQGIETVRNVIIRASTSALEQKILSHVSKEMIAKKMGVLENQVAGYCQLGFALVMPAIEDISEANLSSGLLDGIFFTGEIAGSIMKISINLSL